MHGYLLGICMHAWISTRDMHACMHGYLLGICMHAWISTRDMHAFMDIY